MLQVRMLVDCLVICDGTIVVSQLHIIFSLASPHRSNTADYLRPRYLLKIIIMRMKTRRPTSHCMPFGMSTTSVRKMQIHRDPTKGHLLVVLCVHVSRCRLTGHGRTLLALHPEHLPSCFTTQVYAYTMVYDRWTPPPPCWSKSDNC